MSLSTDDSALAILSPGRQEGAVETVVSRAARLAANLLGTAAALVWLEEGDQLAVATPGRESAGFEATACMPWCRQVIEASEPIGAREWRPRRQSTDAGTAADPLPVALLGIPLKTSGEGVVGVLAVIDPAPRDWEEAEAQSLTDLGSLLMGEMERWEAVKRLADAQAREKQAIEQLEITRQSQSTLLSTVRHAFGQPLTVIQGFSELIHELELSESEIKEYAAEIGKEAAHLTELVARLR